MLHFHPLAPVAWCAGSDTSGEWIMVVLEDTGGHWLLLEPDTNGRNQFLQKYCYTNNVHNFIMVDAFHN